GSQFKAHLLGIKLFGALLIADVDTDRSDTINHFGLLTIVWFVRRQNSTSFRLIASRKLLNRPCHEQETGRRDLLKMSLLGLQTGAVLRGRVSRLAAIKCAE